MKNFTGFPGTTWDQLSFFTKKFSDQQVRFVVRLNGRLDEKILGRAVEASLQAEPILRCRFREKFRRPLWEVIPDLSLDRIFSIRETADPEAEIRRFLIQDIDPLEGPVIRVGLIRSQADTVCINLDHTAGDASSVRVYAYLLASLYRNLQKNPEYSPASGVLRPRGFRRTLDKLTVREKAGLLRWSFTPPKRETSWRFPWKSGEIARSKRILVRGLPDEKSSALIRFSAYAHSWPNDVILAAYFRALHAVISPDEKTLLKITVPVDMRAYLPAGERGRIANLSSSFDAVISRIGADFPETLSLVEMEMKEKRTHLPGMPALFQVSPVLKLFPYKAVKKILIGGKIGIPPPPPWLIQMGILQPERLAFGDVSAGAAYPLQSAGRAPVVFQLGVSRFENRFTFSVCFYGDEEEARLADSFLDLLEKELPG